MNRREFFGWLSKIFVTACAWLLAGADVPQSRKADSDTMPVSTFGGQIWARSLRVYNYPLSAGKVVALGRLSEGLVAFWSPRVSWQCLHISAGSSDVNG